MWILSQDNEILLNANCFYITRYPKEDGKTIYMIKASIDCLGSSFIVGEYSTEEKAKEVFNCLVDRIYMTANNSIVELGVYKIPYKLPKDEEVN